ncbi:hypothetical protein [Paenibacillus amylolyticus]|uniref:Uncharacterized protein n=1 Tax=Paenibacillus amylolyticus TaxID=1451 RepID=A0ABD8B328_PAEAM
MNDRESMKRSVRTKGIGDTTSVTIPAQYVDCITGEIKPVTPEILHKVNSALSQRELVHLVFTGIAAVDSLGMIKSSFNEIQTSLNELMGWNSKAM